MGIAIAEAARDRGASVKLITSLDPQPNIVGVEIIDGETAEEMAIQTKLHAQMADAIIMAAAVSDWKPTDSSLAKIKKDDLSNMSLDLTKTEDIIGSINDPKLIKVAFAAETQNLLKNAKLKLTAKKLDLIVANEVKQTGSVFGSDTNKVILIDKNGREEDLPEMRKYDLGHLIIDRVKAMIEART